MAYNPITSDLNGSYIVSYISVASPTPVAVAGTYYKALGTTTVELSRNITMPLDNRYTIATDGIYQFNITTTSITTSNNNTISIQLYKNGLPIPSTIQQARADNTPTPVNIGTSYICPMLAGDYVEVWLTNITATNAVTFSRMTININELYSA